MLFRLLLVILSSESAGHLVIEIFKHRSGDQISYIIKHVTKLGLELD